MDIDYFASDRLIEPSVGDLLISEPYLPDKNFERSVVLLCEHNEDGTFGLVLNHSTGKRFDELVTEVNSFDSEVFVGGPVQQNTLHFIHRAPDLIDHVMQIDRSLFYGGNQDKLMTLIDTYQIRKEDFRFFVGYSGWSPGQLMDELRAKSWIVYKGLDSDQLFDIPADQLWRHILHKMGGKFKAMANYPVDPRMN